MESEEQLKKDIMRPDRYLGASGKDLIDLCPDLNIDFTQAAKFNIFKYLMRAGKKEGSTALKDYLKAEVYLKRLIDFERKRNVSLKQQAQ
jgi:hypothetical protein